MKIKSGFRKAAIVGLTLLVTASCAFAAGCSESEKESGGVTSEESAVTIVLNRKTVELDVGETFALVATVTGTTDGAVFSSENTTVATVSETGVITGVSDGTTRIYATVGQDRVVCNVTVAQSLRGVSALSLDRRALTLYEGYEMAVEVLFTIGDEAQTVDLDALVWSSDTEAVATVENGVVKGVGAGKAKISAAYAYEGKTYAASLEVNVKELASYVVSTETTTLASSVTYGGRVNDASNASKIKIERVSKNETTEIKDLGAFTFTSSDEEIAKAVNGQVVAGKKTGSAKITAWRGETEISAFTVEVKTAISSKYDLDMLALAYAREKHEADWSRSASYLLTNDIDYDGAIFIPIAADVHGNGMSTPLIGLQWKNILAEGNEYGLTYEKFCERWLNSVDPMCSDMNGIDYYKTGFCGTIDGNGYAIKNVKMMYDATIGTRSANVKTIITTTSLIGQMGTGCTLKNIAFENVGVQTASEAGYAWGSAIDGGLRKVGSTETVTVSSAGYYFSSSFGVFGCGSAVLENVYAEIDCKMDTFFINEGLGAHIFGRWIGATKMTNCVFVDNFSDNETTNRGTWNTISGAGQVAANNVVIVTDDTVGAPAQGAFTVVADKAAYKAGVASGAYSADGFDEAIWDTSGDLPKLKAKGGKL